MFRVRIYRFVATISPFLGNFIPFFVEPKRGRISWEVQQKLSNLYLFLILEFLERNHSSSLAIILDFLGQYLIPLAKIELKVTIDKGFNGQSCFDSPEVGDVERLDLKAFSNIALLVASTLPKWEMLKVFNSIF